jgi:hypothetical protein
LGLNAQRIPVVNDCEAAVKPAHEVDELVRVAACPVAAVPLDQPSVLVVRVRRDVRQRDVELRERVVGICAAEGGGGRY